MLFKNCDTSGGLLLAQKAWFLTDWFSPCWKKGCNYSWTTFAQLELKTLGAALKGSRLPIFAAAVPVGKYLISAFFFFFFPGSESVVHPFPDSAPQRWGSALSRFHAWLSTTPPSGTPEGRSWRHVLFEGRPSLPNRGQILAPSSQHGQDLGRTAGPGNPTPVMSWQIQSAQAAPKVRHGKQTHGKEVDESLS